MKPINKHFCHTSLPDFWAAWYNSPVIWAAVSFSLKIFIMNASSSGKCLLQEKVAKFKGAGSVIFDTTQVEGMIKFKSALEVHLRYNGRVKLISVRSDDYFPTKKEAEQEASQIMLANKDFIFFCNTLNWANSQEAFASTTLSPNKPFENAKGTFLERIAKMTQRPAIAFDTTSIGPFKCILTVTPVGGSEAISVCSDVCSTKKEAEQQASGIMLNDPRFNSLGMKVSRVEAETPEISSLEAASSISSLTTINSTSATVSAPLGSENFKGKLLENMTKLGGRVNFDCAVCPGGFATTATAVMVKFTTSFVTHSARAFVSKKEADQSAARVMLQHPGFDEWLRTGAAPAGEVDNTTTSNVLHSDSASVCSVKSTTTSSSALSSLNAPHLNPKGILYEKAIKMLPRPELDYQTTSNAPFICTLTATVAASDAGSSDTTITMQGGPCGTKKAAEQEAAALMLTHVRFISLGQSAVDSSDDTVRCSQCKGLIGHVSDFCFYDKSETEVQFALKPEIVKQVLSKASPLPGAPPQPKITYAGYLEGKLEQSQNVAVCCGLCKTCVGSHLPFGPDGVAITTFKNTEVSLKGVTFPTSRTWRIVSKEPAFESVAHRTPLTFYGVEMESAVRPVCDLTAVVHPEYCEECGLESPDFQYTDLLSETCGKVPRREQIEAFQMTLHHHAITVFPTGFGKTLVASMVMHRYRKLNPAKLVLMVEERVPLVEQQCVAVQADTGMTLCPVYGENCSSRTVKEALGGDFDGVVITAGALYNYLSQDLLRVCDFSMIVFDESHHATKNHQYKLILAMIAQYPVYLQPRVLGLTASPLKEKTEGGATQELEDIRETFLGADVYRPPGIGANISEDLQVHAVALSAEQRTMQCKVVNELQPLVEKLSVYYSVSRPNVFAQLIGEKPIHLNKEGNKFEWMRVTQLSAESYLDPLRTPAHIVAMAAKMREMVAALEHNYLLGPSFVTLYGHTVEASIEADVALEDSPLKGGFSPQLRQLCGILAAKGADSCTLVFVETRYVAKIVHQYLCAKFPILMCEKMVGQSGEEGMKWRGEEGQRAILRDFHHKTCKLIVCTSVLEEGLDVRGCNLVIRLGGTPSLIRLVQSKGRARADNGELHLICTAEENHHFQKLMSQEMMLDRVLADFTSISL